MKKMTKTSKIILSSGLSLITLIPIISVAATSCSSNSDKDKDSSIVNTPTTNLIYLDQNKLAKFFKNKTNAEIKQITNDQLKQEVFNCLSPFSNTKLDISDITEVLVNYLNNDAINLSIKLKSNYVFESNSQNLLQTNNFSTKDDINNWFDTVTNVSFNRNQFVSLLNKSDYEDLTKDNNALIINDFIYSCTPQLNKSDISISSINKSGTTEKPTISFSISLPSNKYMFSSGTIPGDSINCLNFNNVNIALTSISQIVFDKDKFTKEVAKLSYDDANNLSNIKNLVLSCGIKEDQLSSNPISITGNANSTAFGSLETVSITLNLNDKSIFIDNSRELVLSNLATTTLKVDKLETNVLSSDNMSNINKSLQNLSDVNEDNIKATLISDGLPANAIKTISLSSINKVPGQPITFSFVVDFNLGYTYNNQAQYQFNQIKTNTNYVEIINHINDSEIIDACKTLDSKNINLTNLQDSLNQAGFPKGSVASVSFNKNQNLQPGQPISGTLTIQLTSNYKLANNATSYQISNVVAQDKMPAEIQTLTFDKTSFETWMHNESYDELTTNNHKVIYDELSKVITSTNDKTNALIKSNISSIVNSINLVKDTNQTPNKPINVTLTLDLNPAYKFAEPSNNTINTTIKDLYVQGCTYDLNAVKTAISQLSWDQVSDGTQVKELLLKNGLPENSVQLVSVAKCNDSLQVPNQPITINVSIKMNDGYSLNSFLENFKAQIKDVFIKSVSSNHETFDNSINSQTIEYLENQSNNDSLKEIFAKNANIPLSAINSIQIGSNTPNVGENYVAKITINLNSGYVFDTTNKTQLSFDVPLNEIKTSKVSMSSITDVLNTPINNQIATNVTQDYVSKLITSNEELKNEVQSVSIDNSFNSSGQYLAKNITINLKKGYVFDETNYPSTKTFNINTKTLNIPWINYSVFAYQVTHDDYNNYNKFVAKPTVAYDKQLSQLGEPGTNNLITSSSLSLSKPVKDIIGTSDFASDVVSELSYTFKNALDEYFKKHNVTLALNDNFYALNTLKVSKNLNGEFVINGKLGFEFINKSDSNLVFEKDNTFLKNDSQITLSQNNKIGVCYTFDNAKIIPISYETTVNNKPITKLEYKLSNVNLETINNNISSTNKSIELTPFTSEGQSLFMDVTLNGVASDKMYNYYSLEPEFNSYLSGLTKDKITSNIKAQDDDVYGFVKGIGSGLDSVLSTLAKDPTIRDFLISLAPSINYVVFNLTRNQEFANFISGMLTTKESIHDYLFGSNSSSIVYKKILEFLKVTILSKYSDAITSFYKMLNPDEQAIVTNIWNFINTGVIPEGVSPKVYVAGTLATLATLSNPSSTKPVVEQFLDVLNTFMKKDATNVSNKLLNDANTKSFIDFLGVDIQYVLKEILDATQSEKDDNSLAWSFLNNVYTLLTTIEKDESITSGNILDIKLLDAIDKPEQNKLIVELLNTSVQPLLDILIPNSANIMKKVMPFVVAIVNTLNNSKTSHDLLLHLFMALSKPQVQINNKWTSTTYNEIFNKYVTFTPTVEVKSYDQKTHKISYTNTLSFSFNNTIQFDLNEVKTDLNATTIGDLLKELNTTLQLNLKEGFNAHDFIDAFLKKFQINTSNFGDLIDYIPWGNSKSTDKDLISPIKLSDLFPSNPQWVKGDNVVTRMSCQDSYLNPKVIFNKITWWTNTEVNSTINIKNTINSMINPGVDYLSQIFYSVDSGKLLKKLCKVTAESLVNAFFDNVTYNFADKWLNQEILTNPTALNYVQNVENMNYSTIENTLSTDDLNKIRTILQNSKYQSTLAIDKDHNVVYYPTDNSELDNELLPIIFNKNKSSWMFDNSNPSLRPTIVIKYVPEKKITVGVPGGINQYLHSFLSKTGVITIPGKYVVNVQFPTSVAISKDGGQTYTMKNSISIPLNINKK